MNISEKTKSFMQKQDANLNKKLGWEANLLAFHLNILQLKGSVEVGWREACGSTDRTMKEHEAWTKVIKKLVTDGNKISEERVKHNNRYAGCNGGFWCSIIYTVMEEKGE